MSDVLQNEDGSFKYPLVEPSDNLFLVERTSQYRFDENRKPCEHAQPATIKSECGEDQFSNAYILNIESIAQLMSLVGTQIDPYGDRVWQLIVGINIAGYNTIEIYDDYREL